MPYFHTPNNYNACRTPHGCVDWNGSAHSVDPSSDKTALDNLLDGDYQIISFEHDNDLQTYVVWKSVEEDESVNKHQTITKEVTPNGEVLRILIVNENA